MFKKSKIKIVALIMIILVVLLVGIVSIIYGVSYKDINSQNHDMLQLYADEYAVKGEPDEEIREDLNIDKPEDRLFQASTFYSVYFSNEGKALEIHNTSNSLYSDEELSAYASKVLNSSKGYGTSENITYLITTVGSNTLVTMMDTVVIDESLSILLDYTLIFGGISLFIFLIISIFLANWIIHPLEEAYQKQKQFISDAGHELKTPISTINTNAELLSRTTGENKWLSNIQYENKRMSYIVHQLLDLAKMESIQVIPEIMDLSRIVLASSLPFEGLAYEKGLTFSYSVREGIQINGNPGQMGELVSVLLDNALQHSIEGGSITIFLSCCHGSVSLSVVNQGEEIPVDQRDKIFERFYRADTARNSESNRYGLGLAIAKAIVTAHNGKISVSCNAGFTTFTVTIPKRVGKIGDTKK